MFLTIDLSSQVDYTSNQIVSQNWLVLLVKIIQKNWYQKFFTIVKPLFYLELRGKILRLPANSVQTGVDSRKCDFLAFLEKFSLIC